MLEQTTDRKNRKLATHLSGVLSDTYLLYNTTQFCHWNVVGSQFRPLHEMFEEQYRDLAEAVDMIAERIRIVGFYTPGTLHEFIEASELTQQPRLRDTSSMLRSLIEGHDTIARRLSGVIEASREADDTATEDMAIERQRAHQKVAWMLRSQADDAFDDLQLESAVQELAGKS